MIELYTLPNCDKCSEVKDYLKSKGILYKEKNAGVGETKREFVEFARAHRELKRDEEHDGMIAFPVLLTRDNGEIRIHQGREGLEGFLGI